MADSDNDILSRLFLGTISSDASTRHDCEQQLQSLRSKNGYILSILKFIASICTKSTDPRIVEVSQAATIELKNVVKVSWRNNGDTLSNTTETVNATVFSEEEKNLIRTNILHVLIATSHYQPVVKLLAEVIKFIAREDFPDKWPTLLPQLIEQLTRNDLRSTFACLLVLEKLAKNSIVVTQNGGNLADSVFPILTQLLSTIISNFGGSNDEWLVVCHLSKIYYNIIWYKIPLLLQQEDYVIAWVNAFNFLVRQPVDEILYSNFFGEKRKIPIWVTKKYAIRCLYRLFERYGFKQYCDAEFVDFSKLFTEKSIVNKSQSLAAYTLETMFIVADLHEKGAYVTPLVLRFAVFYVTKATEISSLYTLFKDRIPAFMRDIIFPLLALSPEDIETWVTDEAQFIRDKFSFDYLVNIASDPHEAASSFVEEVSSSRLSYVMPFILELITEKLTKSPSNAEAQEIARHYGQCFEVIKDSDDAADFAKVGFNGFVSAQRKFIGLKALEDVGEILVQSSLVSPENIQQIIMTQVVPLMQSEVFFLRYQAIKTLGRYLQLKWLDGSQVAEFTGIFLKLLDDPKLSIRAQACLSVVNFVRSRNEIVIHILGENLRPIIGRILETSRGAIIEEIYETLQVLMAKFPWQVVPMASELLHSLVESFLEFYLVDNNDDEEGDNEIAAIDCLTSINDLLSSVGEQEDGEQNIQRCFETLWPALSVIFFGVKDAQLISQQKSEEVILQHITFVPDSDDSKLDGMDFVQSALETVRIITFYGKFVPAKLWRIIPYLCRDYAAWASDFTQDFFGTFENMIHYDLNGFLTLHFAENIKYGRSNLDGVMYLTFLALNMPKDDVNELEKCYVLSMLQVFLQSLKLGSPSGSVVAATGNTIKELLNISLKMLPAAEIQHFKVNLLVLIETCIFFDASMTLQILGKNQFSKFFQMWMSMLDKHEAMAEVMASYVAALSLLSLDNLDAKVHQQLIERLPGMLKKVDALKKKKEELIIQRKEQMTPEAQVKNLLSEEADDNGFGLRMKKSQYPRDVPDDMNVISSEFANDIKSTKLELERLKPFLPSSGDDDENDGHHNEKYRSISDRFAVAGDDDEEESAEATDGDQDEDYGDDFQESYSAEEDGDFVDEEEEEEDEESPLDHLDEKVLLYKYLQGLNETGQKNFQKSLQKMSSHNRKLIEQAFAEGQNRSQQ